MFYFGRRHINFLAKRRQLNYFEWVQNDFLISTAFCSPLIMRLAVWLEVRLTLVSQVIWRREEWTFF